MLRLGTSAVALAVGHKRGHACGKQTNKQTNTLRIEQVDGAEALQKPVRVMVVDDHPPISKAWERLLARVNGFEPIERGEMGVGSVREAVRLIEAHRPQVVVLDICLGGEESFEVIRSCAPGPEAPRFVCYSAYANPEYVQQAEVLGAWGYLLKGETGEPLLRAVEAVVGGCRVFSREIQAVRSVQQGGESVGPASRLTAHERRVLGELWAGKNLSQIGREVGRSHTAVRRTVKRARRKLGLIEQGPRYVALDSGDGEEEPDD